MSRFTVRQEFPEGTGGDAIREAQRKYRERYRVEGGAVIIRGDGSGESEIYASFDGSPSFLQHDPYAREPRGAKPKGCRGNVCERR